MSLPNNFRHPIPQVLRRFWRHFQLGRSAIACNHASRHLTDFLTIAMTQQNPQYVKMSKWIRKSSMHFFERNPDVLGVPGFVPLGHKMVVDVMSTGFEAVTRDTFFIACRARQILSNNLKSDVYREEDIFKAELELNKLLDQMHEYFDTRIHQGELKLQMGGFDPASMQRLVANYETNSCTNAVTQYIDILAKADNYLTIVQYLWVTSELSDNPNEAMKVKLNIEREVKTNLYAIARASTAHYNNIRRICDEVVKNRQTARANQSAQDKKHHAQAKQEAAQKEAKKAAAAEKRKGKARLRREAERKDALSAAKSHQDQLVTAATA